MLKSVVTLLSASALAAALATPALAKDAPAPVAADASKSADAKSADDWGWGIKTANMDTTVKPGDDFNRFVNGKWLDTTEIPADRTTSGAFADLPDLSEERMHAILEEIAKGTHAPGSPEARVAAVYKAS